MAVCIKEAEGKTRGGWVLFKKRRGGGSKWRRERRRSRMGRVIEREREREITFIRTHHRTPYPAR